MEYTLLEEVPDSLERKYEISLSADEAAELEEEVRAFFAVQAGVEYIAQKTDDDSSNSELDHRIALCLANQCADKIIEKEGLSAAMEPSVDDVTELGEEKGFDCKATIFLKPDLVLTSYDELELDIPEFTVSPEMLETHKQAIIDKHSRYIEDADADKVLDCSEVIISLETTKCGMQVLPLTYSDMFYQLGSKRLPEEIEQQILGMRPGETKTFSYELTSKNFLGLDVDEKMDTELTVSKIVKKETPEVTDEWVKDNIPGAHDVESFEKLVEENVTSHARADYEKLKVEAASSALAKRLPTFEVPDMYYDYVRAGLLQNVSAALDRQGMSKEELYSAQGITEDQFMIQMKVRAQEVLRQGYALDALARHEKFEASEKDLEQAAATISPREKDKVRKMLEMNGRTYQLREMATRMKARAFMVEHLI